MEKKPEWLKVGYSPSVVNQMNEMFSGLKLNTVCNEANCPNRHECYQKHTATFLIMGANCTRHCRFCNVSKNCATPLDPDEPANVALAAKQMGLRHVVITSVTRDDLPDGGAEHFARVTAAIRQTLPEATIELLIPDLQGNADALRMVVEAKPDILAHNLETVPSLYSEVRPEADYRQSLWVLSEAKRLSPDIITKSGIMVGLGETEEEVYALFDDAAAAGCDIMTVGQYLRPTKQHLPVKEYVHPDIFEKYRLEGMARGIRYVYSAPLVRSSYNAKEALDALLSLRVQ